MDTVSRMTFVDDKLWMCDSKTAGMVIILVSFIDQSKFGEGVIVYSTNDEYRIGDHDTVWPMWLFEPCTEAVTLMNGTLQKNNG